MKASGKRAAAAVARGWRHPIGTHVTVRKDNGELVHARTRSMASVVGGTAVIWVEGIAGCYALERVTAGKCPSCGHLWAHHADRMMPVEGRVFGCGATRRGLGKAPKGRCGCKALPPELPTKGGTP
jgi:hypothetical protein